MLYEIKFTNSAEKYLKKLYDKKLLEIIKRSLERIAVDPYSISKKKGDLINVYSCDIRYNNTNYELAYKIYENEGHYILVLLIGSRENFYKELKRSLK